MIQAGNVGPIPAWGEGPEKDRPVRDDMVRRLEWLVKVQESLGRELNKREKKDAQRWFNFGMTEAEFIVFVGKR